MDDGSGNAELADDLAFLLSELCAEWGFCGHLSAHDLLSAGRTLDANLFADMVLRADGMTPEYQPRWKQRIANRFCEKFGASITAEAIE